MRTHRFLRPLLYTSAATAVGSAVLYWSYRPRHIPGSDPAAVPLRFAADGSIAPPRFPKIKSREAHIQDLKRSGGHVESSRKDTNGCMGGLLRGWSQKEDDEHANTEPYDLLIIGGGATGAGIALDAATRGLKVAMVERDDFSSGTSSKSTKLVHGGVRYLEKAVWELDYNQ